MIKNSLRKQLRNFQQQPRVFPALMGDGYGKITVKGRPNYVWIRIAGQPVTQVYNNRVAPELDLPVMVGHGVCCSSPP